MGVVCSNEIKYTSIMTEEKELKSTDNIEIVPKDEFKNTNNSEIVRCFVCDKVYREPWECSQCKRLCCTDLWAPGFVCTLCQHLKWDGRDHKCHCPTCITARKRYIN